MLTIRQSVLIQQQGNALVGFAYIIITFFNIDIFNCRGLVGSIQMKNSLIRRNETHDAHEHFITFSKV